MKSLKLFLVIFFISLISLVFITRSVPEASLETCGQTVDLREPGQSLAGYPTGHQGFGETNLCGFYSSAAMIDAWRSGLDSSPSLSKIDPVALAVELARDRDLPIWLPLQNTTDGLNNRKGRWGSIVCAILNYAREYGVCTHRAYDPSNWREQGNFADKNIQIFDILFEFGRRSTALERKRNLHQVALRVQQLYHELPPRPSKKIELEGLKDLIFKNDIHPYRTIAALMHADCGENRVKLEGLPACHSGYHVGLDLIGSRKLERDYLRTDRALNQIHNALSQPRPLPVSIAYCGRIMREGRAFRNRSLLSKGCSPHWALVIGRKVIDGRCHLLIRNSSDPEKDYSPDWIRDGMDVWMDARALQRTIYSVQWLE